jgi:short-subunit dehydrogenase
LTYKTIALVTGANKGIGSEICRQLAQKEFHVLLGSRDEARGREAATTLARKGAEVEAVVVDLAAPATFEKTRQFIGEQFGRLDVLINNAGVCEPVQAAASSMMGKSCPGEPQPRGGRALILR